MVVIEMPNIIDDALDHKLRSEADSAELGT